MSKNFQGQWNDYENNNRINNLLWTVSGDYSAFMSEKEKIQYASKEIALYYGIMAGARRKYLDWPLINRYFYLRINQGFNKEFLLPILQMGSDLISFRQLQSERPGVFDIREKAYHEILKIKDTPRENTFIEDVSHRFIQHFSNAPFPQSEELDPFIQKILMLERHESTLDFLENVDMIYLDFFKTIPHTPFEKLDFSEKPPLKVALVSEIEGFISNSLLSSKKGKEGSHSSKVADAKTIYVDSESSKNIKKQVAHYYGSSFLSNLETKKLQHLLCRGVHLDCKLHFTDGLLRSNSPSDFQKKYAKRDTEKNWRAFKNNQLLYQRTIARLRDGLLRTLISERSTYTFQSMQGKLAANRVWRVGRSPYPKIFHQNQNNDKGNFVVDLLMDASSSQQNRESDVSIQAYIVAQALLEARIPCRVSCFSSFMNYTIIKRFRDYNDPSSQNSNIFEYRCVGSNRDGLAIKGVCHQLYRRPEENKILIILSDGKPNDIKLIPKEKQDLFRGETAYTGGLAIADTAKEVRLARQRGIMVLGVFTGSPYDLPGEKIIYDKDFIYSKNMSHFAEVVMSYLKRIIQQ
ncbi:MAG: hypothetical protein ACRCU3_00415 [Eubacteriaceae bacterium]